jgi:hypothetical protein
MTADKDRDAIGSFVICSVSGDKAAFCLRRQTALVIMV